MQEKVEVVRNGGRVYHFPVPSVKRTRACPACPEAGRRKSGEGPETATPSLRGAILLDWGANTNPLPP